jgi:hypothetical protein
MKFEILTSFDLINLLELEFTWFARLGNITSIIQGFTRYLSYLMLSKAHIANKHIEGTRNRHILLSLSMLRKVGCYIPLL